jgi:hypothetical protein
MNEATFTVSPEDCVAANRLHFLKSISIKRWLEVFILSAAALALFNFGFDWIFDLEGYLIVLGSIWAFLVTVCVAGWFMIPRQARRNWRQAQKMWIERRVSWDADKIHFESEKGQVHVNWSDYYRWAADDRSLLLYQDDRTFHLVPLRNLPSGACDAITEYLKAAGVQER